MYVKNKTNKNDQVKVKTSEMSVERMRDAMYECPNEVKWFIFVHVVKELPYQVVTLVVLPSNNRKHA